MATVAVVYHSGYGHTEKQAQAVFKGAQAVGDALLISVTDIDSHWSDLEQADAIIFGAPTYMGSVSAEFKKFMDASSKTWFPQLWKDKIAGGFTNSASWSGDKFNSLVQLATFAAQHGMIWVPLGILPANNSKSQRNDLNRVGSYLGAAAQSDADASPEAAPPHGDLLTAEEYGKRVAQIAKKFTGR